MRRNLQRGFSRQSRKRNCAPIAAESRCRGQQATLPHSLQKFPSAGIACTLSGFLSGFLYHPNRLEVCAVIFALRLFVGAGLQSLASTVRGRSDCSTA